MWRRGFAQHARTKNIIWYRERKRERKRERREKVYGYVTSCGWNTNLRPKEGGELKGFSMPVAISNSNPFLRVDYTKKTCQMSPSVHNDGEVRVSIILKPL